MKSTSKASPVLRCGGCGIELVAEVQGNSCFVAAHACSRGAQVCAAMASLARAIESLGAVDLGEGRYAYKTCAGWRILDGPANVALALDLYENARGYTGRAMPSWWTPEQRLAYEVVDFDGKRVGEATTDYQRASYTFRTRGNCGGVRRITADLATGEEVPADAPAR